MLADATTSKQDPLMLCSKVSSFLDVLKRLNRFDLHCSAELAPSPCPE